MSLRACVTAYQPCVTFHFKSSGDGMRQPLGHASGPIGGPEVIYVTTRPASVLLGGVGLRDILFDIVNKQGTVVGEKPVAPCSSVQLRQETGSAQKSREASARRPSSTLVLSVFPP